MNLSKLSGMFLFTACILFLLLTTTAMLTYPGSAPHHLTSTKYEFTQNTFSDLGTTTTYRGETNNTSRTLYTLALTLVGVGIAIMGWTQSKIYTRASPTFRIISAVTATISGLGFIAVAYIPSNSNYPQHLDAMNVAFSFLLAFTITTTFIQIKSHWMKKYIIANCLFITILGVFGLVLAFGPPINTPHGLTIQVIAQKIVAYTAIINITYQSLGEIRNSKKIKKQKMK